jgi:hypothetical protein
MATTGELNKAIMDTTMKIRAAYPELMKYITEMPVTIPDSKQPQINEAALKDYHHSLVLLFDNYAAGHASKTAGTQIKNTTVK